MTRALLIAFTLFVASCGGKDKEESGGGDTTGEKDGKKDGKKDGSGSAGSGSAVADGSGAGSGSGAGGDVAKAALPTEVDFEDDSVTKITEKTVEADLANLEKEIGDGEVKKDDGKEEPKDPKKEEPKKP